MAVDYKSEKRPTKEYVNLDKRISGLKKLVIGGMIGTAGLFIINKLIDFYVLDNVTSNAKTTLSQKEVEWEMKIKKEIRTEVTDLYSKLPTKIESSLTHIGSKYITNYWPDIDKDLPFEKKWEIACQRMKDNEKEKLLDDLVDEFTKGLEKLDIEDDKVRRFCDIFIEQLRRND
ncbi:hypothetical protein GF358_02895 [Candidatus Woesearchaeota archaeon]|nr:hypothetical protein [Candidatus Woesearchaeota archaeon]